MNHAHKTIVLLTLTALSLGCGYSKPSMPSQGSMPAISQLNPPDATAGTASFPLEVDGANFATNAVINFAGVAMTTTSGGSGKVTAMIPASAIATAGMVPVTVTNPASGGIYGTPAVTSTAKNFTIN